MNTVSNQEIDNWVLEHGQDESAHVKPASEYRQEVNDFFHADKTLRGLPMPFSRLQFNFDLRPNEVTLWLGFNGHGKSLILGQVIMSMMAQKQRCLIASLEMRPVTTLSRMCRQASQGENPAMDFIDDFAEWTNERLWMYDQHGSVGPGRILNLCRYAAEKLKITHLVVDSLMKVIPDEEDVKAVKHFVDKLCICARDTGMHIHLVHHSRKGQDENTPPGKMDARGTGSITDLVDNCVTVWRNKQKAEAVAAGKEPKAEFDALLKIDKQRHGEWEGAVPLYFHPPSHQFLGTRGAQPMSFVP